MRREQSEYASRKKKKNLSHQRKANKKHFTDKVIFKTYLEYILPPDSKELIF